MTQYPGFIFYPNDWLTDDKLKLCSFATKGAWMDIICLMYKSKRRGYLVVNDKSLNKNDIKKLLKCNDDEFELIWSELIENGVMSQHMDGTYYSKRVVNDTEKNIPQHGLNQEDLDTIDKVLAEFDVLVKDHSPYSMSEAKDLIAIRMKRDGAKFNDFISVIKGKYKEWNDNDTMRPHLRPRTLFGEKFKRYLHELSPKVTTAVEEKNVVPRFDYGDM